ncbi:MAG: anti-sigma factor antagonist [Solirubrobacterales bacterium]|nr:anti-sigma factor antagonist [Solirubrobacterales bacterium]
MAPNRGSFAGVRTGELALERNDAGMAVLTISGEHDLSTAPNLRRRLDSLLAERTPVVIDLSPATFIDSSILGVILEGRRRAADAGIGFAVVHSNGADAVDRVLEVTGLRAELPVHSRREEALSEVSGSSGKPPE